MIIIRLALSTAKSEPFLPQDQMSSLINHLYNSQRAKEVCRAPGSCGCYDLLIRIFNGCGQGQVTTFLGFCSHVFEMEINVITNGYHLESKSVSKGPSILGLLFHLLLLQM